MRKWKDKTRKEFIKKKKRKENERKELNGLTVCGQLFDDKHTEKHTLHSSSDGLHATLYT